MNALMIANTQIRRDDAGRYCLNDLHQASGGEAKNQPPRWLRLVQTQDLIQEMLKTGDRYPEMGSGQDHGPVMSIEGGLGQGTYAVKELVYAYAMWISAAFHLHVIRAYDAMVTARSADDVPSVPASPQHRADVLVSAARGFSALIRAGRCMGMDRVRSVKSANAATFRATGIDLVTELDADDVLDARLAGPVGIRSDSPHAAVADFLQELQGGALGVSCMPCLGVDAFELYGLWCRQRAIPMLSLIQFVHALCDAHGVVRAAKRYQVAGAIVGPVRLLMWGYAAPADQPEPAYLGQCVRAFQAGVKAYAQQASGEGVTMSRGYEIADRIRTWVAGRTETTTTAVIEGALQGDPVNKELQARVGIALRRLGWKATRSNQGGKRVRGWVAPGGS